MRTRSLAQLIGDVRVRSDQVTSNGQIAYIDDATIAEWLNQAWADLYDRLIKTGEHYYLSRDVYLTVAGQQAYPLPHDHYKTMGVSVVVNSYPQPAHRFQFERRDDMQPMGGMSWPYDLHYDLWGQTMQWLEPVASGYEVRHHYYPVAQRMNPADPANSFIDGVNGWEVYVRDWAAKMCATRDENFDLANVLQGDIDRAMARIVSMSSTRNPGEAPKTRIVRGNGTRRGVYPRSGPGGTQGSGGP